MSEETQNPHYALGEEDVRNRRDMQVLQTEFNLHKYRRDLSSFIWHGDPCGKLDANGKYNGNSNRSMDYVFEIPCAFVLRVFAVSTDLEAVRVSHPERFKGPWRKISYPEIQKLRPRSLNGLTRHQTKKITGIPRFFQKKVKKCWLDRVALPQGRDEKTNQANTC